MKWNTKGLPKETGRYVVSLEIKKPHGIMIFHYVAYYDAETNKWFKFDPFVDNYQHEKEIEGKVTAWMSGLGIHK